MPRTFVLLLLLAVPGVFAHAGEGDVRDELAAARVEAALRLEVVAKAAHTARLFLARNETYELLLTFDADHAKARAWLKYRRKGGEWVRDRFTPPKNRGNAASLAEHEHAVAAWNAWWCNRLIGIHAQAKEEGDAETAGRVLEDLLARSPDDPEVRRLAGFVPVGEGALRCWVLEDTRKGLENRARFLAAARKAARAVKTAKPGQLEPEDRGTPDPWTSVLQGATVRAIGAVGEVELRRHHQIAEAAPAVFSEVFGVTAAHPPLQGAYGRGVPLYVAVGRLAGNTWLAGEPGMTQRDMRFLRTLALSYFPSRMGALIKTDSARTRYEATCHASQSAFQAEHLHFWGGTRGAWLLEATGLYLTWLQVRTRLLYTVADVQGPYANQRPDVPSWNDRMGDQTQDWHALAADAIRSVPNAEVHLTAGKGVNDLTSVDLLVGYGIAVYVLEVHPEVSAAFCRDVAEQEQVDLDAVLRTHVGVDFETLRPRLLRWLDEMAANAPPPGDPN